MSAHKDFGDYERIKCIGKGAFGTAVLYKRIPDKTDVVIKEIFLSDMTESEKQLAFNEANVLASLNHPNIIKYLGSFEKDGSLFIEMEYADNGNLAQLINLRKERNKCFKEVDLVDIMTQITSAMAYMHSNKILHRDLKTANIFLNKNGSLKIGDFGISKIMTTRIQAQTVVGTPYYLSPEMCEGKDYDEKSDVWAIGCILYELACFRKPFEASNLPSLVQKISMCEYDDIPDVYSQKLSQLIKDILQKDFSKRPSATEIHDTMLPEIKSNFANDNDYTQLLKKGVTERSVLYELRSVGDDMDLYPIELPTKKIVSFSGSDTHFIVVTMDKLVYTWGKDSFGQLGHGVIDI
ncbi:hypothetical protein FQR65_LT15073 [Abscondita terminalis]|nr:hypothetical protein FQR65_LT15073 [Abscondita terminalis]